MSAAARFEPNPKRREDFARLLDFATKLSDGARVSWIEVTQATGVEMTKRGQDLLRLAMKRAKRPYLPIAGTGFECSSPENALEVVASKTRRFVGALEVARETTSQVSVRHLDAMTQDRKNKLIHHQALFDTLALNASLAKRLPAK